MACHGTSKCNDTVKLNKTNFVQIVHAAILRGEGHKKPIAPCIPSTLMLTLLEIWQIAAGLIPMLLGIAIEKNRESPE